jgi:SpoVK/Ycf46/Vps4 family AAA+-type ATPase
LFEHHANTHSDDSQTAAAFWLALDEIERGNPHAIIIGTANNVDKLPSEIKSRFAGKIISIPMPNKKQKHYLFKKMLRKDKNIVLEDGCDTLFLQNIVDQMSDCSLRDLQLLIDAAKIIYYAENRRDPCDMRYRDSRISSKFTFVSTILLTKKHFQQALDQWKSESRLTKESLFESDTFSKKLQNWSAVLSIAVSVINLAYLGNIFIIKPVIDLFEHKGTSIHG